ncbi:MAG: hypothetical protein EBR79_03155 [Proteobacteria bacterium]|nr:hypothetical protein [Pseudomonadota bacterium]NBX86388.1 hypothetical protein [Pseudomonadota bacterium]
MPTKPKAKATVAPQRIVIMGMSGAGKSTLAAAVGERLGVPYYHLDNIYHLPGWVARPEDEVRREFTALAEQEKWVVDGNFFRLTGSFRQRADVLVFLDYPRWYCMAQVLLRFVRHHSGWQRRVDLAAGFEEKFSFSFLWWVWNWQSTNRPRWLAELENFRRKCVRLRSRKETARWLETL